MYYKQIPKDPIGQLKWRRGVIKAANANEELRKELWIACARDILFYINTFVWTFDPRPDMNGNALGVVPFNTYKFQDEALLQLQENFGKNDIFIDKSRDMGASWINIVFFEWAWHFYPNKLDLLMVSRNESYVDEKGNEKALFSKIDMIHQYLPNWMMPDYDRSKLMLVNFNTGSKITGESTTGDVGRGGRYTAILLDEFAAFEVKDGYKALSATKDATRCRIFNSTYKGVNNAFYECKSLKNIHKLSFFWTSHPEKSRGLYCVKNGLKIIDKKWHKENPDYEFNMVLPQNDSGFRSPWYDWEEGRSVNKIEMAQEVDMNPAGGGYQYFPTSLIEKTLEDHVRPPYRICDFNYDPQAAEPIDEVPFRDNEKGMFKLWCVFNQKGRPDEDGQYFIGCDIAVGTGATPSVLSVGNSVTGEKILEYSNNNILPHDFGRLAVAIARFFVGRDGAGARLNWEANGPGREFGMAVQDTGYGNLYYREHIDTGKVGNFPGWWSGPKEKTALLSALRERMFNSKFINRSRQAVKQCAEYVQGATTIEHEKSKNAQDAIDSTENHGDFVIADAVLNWTMKSEGRYQEETEEEKAPMGSFGWRMEQWKEENKQKSEEYLY